MALFPWGSSGSITQLGKIGGLVSAVAVAEIGALSDPWWRFAVAFVYSSGGTSPQTLISAHCVNLPSRAPFSRSSLKNHHHANGTTDPVGIVRPVSTRFRQSVAAPGRPASPRIQGIRWWTADVCPRGPLKKPFGHPHFWGRDSAAQGPACPKIWPARPARLDFFWPSSDAKNLTSFPAFGENLAPCSSLLCVLGGRIFFSMAHMFFFFFPAGPGLATFAIKSEGRKGAMGFATDCFTICQTAGIATIPASHGR